MYSKQLYTPLLNMIQAHVLIQIPVRETMHRSLTLLYLERLSLLYKIISLKVANWWVQELNHMPVTPQIIS